MELLISALRQDGGTQPRAAVEDAAVAEYAEALARGDKLPPVVVFHDGSDYWLADGFHRVRAHQKAGMAALEVDVREGTLRDAILYSVGANAAHGLRRTNEDKRRAVLTLLRDEEWGQWTDREIARRCGVGNKLVGDVRRELSVSETQMRRPRKATRGGTTYTITPPAPAEEGDFEGAGGEGPEYVYAPPTREPGDDTEQLARERAEEKALPKNGSPLFDWKKADELIGKVHRLPDEIADAYGAAEAQSPEFASCQDAMRGHYRTFQSWKVRLTRCK